MNKIMKNLKTLLIVGAVTFVFIAPIIRLFSMAFYQDGVFTFYNFTDLLEKERTIDAIKNTVIMSLLSTALAVFLGTLFAYIVAYTDVKRKRLIELLIICPTVIPAYIITLSYSTLFSNKGMINKFITSLGFEAVTVYSMWGIVFVLAICSIPMVYLLTLTTLRKVPRDLEFASLTSGFTNRYTMFTINLKQVLPSIISGGVLAFLSSIDNFSVPAFLGTSAGIPVLSTYIYENIISFGPRAFNTAAALSVMLATFALSGTFLQNKLLRKQTQMESIQPDYSVRIPLGRKRKVVEWATIGTLFSINIVPILTMLTSSVQKGYSDSFIENFTLENYKFVFTNQGVIDSFKNSLTLALITSIICIIIGTAIAYMKVRKGGKLVKFMENGISSTYAVPGVVLALSMIFHWSKIPNIYGTVRILLIAYVTRYLILQVKGSVVAISAVEESLEEASIVSGNSKVMMWCKIIIPQITGQVLSSAFLIFIASLTELSISSLIAAAGTRTIGLTIFSLQQSGDYNLSIALSSALVLMILMAYLVISILRRRGKK